MEIERQYISGVEYDKVSGLWCWHVSAKEKGDKGLSYAESGYLYSCKEEAECAVREFCEEACIIHQFVPHVACVGDLQNAIIMILLYMKMPVTNDNITLVCEAIEDALQYEEYV